MNDKGIILPSKRFKQRVITLIVSILIVSGVSYYLGFNPFVIFGDLKYVNNLFWEMMPPQFDIFWKSDQILQAILDTLSMSFMGTLFGGIFALILGFLGASNTMPIRWIRTGVLILLSLIRMIPALVYILIFVIAVGLGPFAGFLTLFITTLSTFGRLFAETIENIDSGPSESIYSVGANRMQVIRYAIIPEVLPSIIANLLFSFDVNVRVSIALGVLGGGGIGFHYDLAMKLLHYKETMAIVFLIIIIIIPMEKISDFQRKKILDGGRFQ